MKLFIYLIIILNGFLFSGQVQNLEIRNFQLYPEELMNGSKILISFEVFNPGPIDLPSDSFKMELKINGKLVSLDDATNPLKVKHNQRYTKEAGKYHYIITNEKEIIVEIFISPKKNSLISPTTFKRTFQVKT